jgi:hypothetical protein
VEPKEYKSTFIKVEQKNINDKFKNNKRQMKMVFIIFFEKRKKMTI